MELSVHVRTQRNWSWAVVQHLAILGPLVFATSLSWAQDQNDQIGFSRNHIFDGSLQGESIDVMTGNLNLRFPIGPRFELGPNFGYQVQLCYNSKIWENECDVSTQQCPGTIRANHTYGLGFDIHFGRIYQQVKDLPTVYRFQSADGSERYFCFPQNSQDCTNGLVNDGSLVQVNKIGNDWKVYPGDGTTITFEAGSQYATRIESQAKRSDEVTPLHYVDIEYESGNIQSIIDSTGREIEFQYPDPNHRLIVIPAFAGVENSSPAVTATYELILTGPVPVKDPWSLGPDQNRYLLATLRPPGLQAGEIRSVTVTTVA